MAPALPVSPEFNHYEAASETDKLSHRRRALASVDNLAIPMEEDDMGLQNQPSLAKDSQEMEQILVDLGNSDLVQGDLLQAIKTLESAGDTLSTGDPDAIFPLSGFDLAEPVDSEGDGSTTDDKIRLLQLRLERRCAFLLRRLRILQARAIGKKISEEAAQTFEKCVRGARKDGVGRPIGLKALLKRVETTAALQANAASRSVVGPKYYRAGTSKGDVTRSASMGIPSGTLTGLEDSAGALRSHLSVVKTQLDSDATASSSGAESNDEAVTYNNVHQQHMPIEKRALWSWQKTRASLASRWVWLQVQVQELEYKIRQHNELHRTVRQNKGAVEFEGEPVGYEGSLPGDEVDPSASSGCTCARVRPLKRSTFKKRKLLQMYNLHLATPKAAKPSDVKCSCSHEESCAVCTGRAEPTQPTPCTATLPSQARVALLDPGYHPVLSDVKDISPSLHVSALSSRSWFRSRCGKAWRARAPPPARPSPQRRHPTKLKRGRPPLSRKIKERDRDDDTSTQGQERRGRGSGECRWSRRQSYDIDNIVIPQSIAAATRPEILTYKEILTPKWRVMEIPETPLNNGVRKYNRMSFDSDDEEDISEAAVQARHSRAETNERSKYMRKQRSRKHNHDTENNHDTTQHIQQRRQSQHMQRQSQQAPVQSQHMQRQSQQAPVQSHRQSTEHETVRPYSPRLFPLEDDQYTHMLANMPEGYRPISPTSPEPTSAGDEVSTLSPLSPLNYDGDDPDDVEWNPGSEKTERRKSTLR